MKRTDCLLAPSSSSSTSWVAAASAAAAVIWRFKQEITNRFVWGDSPIKRWDPREQQSDLTRPDPGWTLLWKNVNVIVWLILTEVSRMDVVEQKTAARSMKAWRRKNLSSASKQKNLPWKSFIVFGHCPTNVVFFLSDRCSSGDSNPRTWEWRREKLCRWSLPSSGFRQSCSLKMSSSVDKKYKRLRKVKQSFLILQFLGLYELLCLFKQLCLRILINLPQCQVYLNEN